MTPAAAGDLTAATQQIRAVLAGRAAGTTACPSEVARRLDPEAWRARMDEVRAAAAQLAAAGEVEVTQRGVVVDIASARGPVRLRRVPPAEPGTPAGGAGVTPRRDATGKEER